MIDPKSPCIIGVARQTWKSQPAPEPLDMWEVVARAAGDDTGSAAVMSAIDAVHLVHCMSWSYDNGPQRLGDSLAITPSYTTTSMLAGTSGQRMVNAAAERMLQGDCEVALIVGGEALATRRHLKAKGQPLPWRYPASDQSLPPINLEEWISPTEWAHDVLQPTTTFAALDAARRTHLGLGHHDANQAEGELMSRLSAVASRDPHAWFPIERSPDEIITASETNRMISSPYTKYMVAIMDVDMAAALIMTTHAKADELGISSDQRVYLRGWSFGRDAIHLASRPYLHRSEAMDVVGRDTLSQVGIGIDEIEHLDLYSCFASSVLFATDALGIDPLGDRDLSVIGGLPYHGGPASNYTTHAIAETVLRLRGATASYGLVTGVGMHMTKHVAAIYGSAPGPLRPPDYDDLQIQIDATDLLAVLDQVSAPTTATIAAATTSFAHSGDPTSALIIANVDRTTRAYARTTEELLISLSSDGDAIGQTITLRPGDNGTNVATLG